MPSYPLAQAAEEFDFESVLYLLEAGADYKLAEQGGITFVGWIRQLGDLREKDEGAFRFEVYCEKFDVVRAWLDERGVDVTGK